MAGSRGVQTSLLVVVLFVGCGEPSEDQSRADASDAAGGAQAGGGSAGAAANATGGTAGTVVDSGADVSFGGTSPDGSAGSEAGGEGGTLVDGCTPIPFELCNGTDDDCDGVIDNGFDFTSTQTCGTCTTNCSLLPSTINAQCIPPSVLDGKTPGTCEFECDLDHFDFEPSIPGCEYFCPFNPGGTNTEDGDLGICGADDDCDGEIDEDVNLCGTKNCGQCGKKCTLPHASSACTKTGPSGASCGPTNTACTIAACDPGWTDQDGFAQDGCESPITDGG